MLGENDRLVRVAEFGHQGAKRRDFLFEAPIRREGVRVGVDDHCVEEVLASGLVDWPDKVQGDAGRATEEDAGGWGGGAAFKCSFAA